MKNKLCPDRKVCRCECYGENPCEFSKAFDRIARKLDLRQVAIDSLRAEQDATAERNGKNG